MLIDTRFIVYNETDCLSPPGGCPGRRRQRVFNWVFLFNRHPLSFRLLVSNAFFRKVVFDFRYGTDDYRRMRYGRIKTFYTKTMQVLRQPFVD